MTDIAFRVFKGGPLGFQPEDKIHQAVDIINKHLTMAMRKGQTYPPPPHAPANKRVHQYRRTFTLRDSWHLIPATFDGTAIRAMLYNNAKDPYGHHYASFVYGSTEFEQHPVHAGRWPKREDLLDRKTMDAEIRALFRR